MGWGWGWGFGQEGIGLWPSDPRVSPVVDV